MSRASQPPSLLPAWLVQRIGDALPSGADDETPLSRIATQLQRRVEASVGAERGLHTVRVKDTPWSMVVDGLRVRELYRAANPSALRAGEPLSVELWHVAAGFDSAMPADDDRSVEWLLVHGDIEVDGRVHQAVGCIRDEAGVHARRLRSATGAVLYRRLGPPASGQSAHWLSDRGEARWEPLLEGVDRWVMWRDATQEAYLIRARAGACAPAHDHLIDEECLVLDGELYFGDQLMRAGDFQLAPAGLHHTVIEAATDALLYQRGEVKA